jgi:hypothetical protein
MDGRALYQEIERLWPDQASRVVFVTGDTLTPALRDFAASCGRPVIEKPFAPSEVRRVVAETAGPEVLIAFSDVRAHPLRFGHERHYPFNHRALYQQSVVAQAARGVQSRIRYLAASQRARNAPSPSSSDADPRREVSGRGSRPLFHGRS